MPSEKGKKQTINDLEFMTFVKEGRTHKISVKEGAVKSRITTTFTSGDSHSTNAIAKCLKEGRTPMDHPITFREILPNGSFGAEKELWIKFTWMKKVAIIDDDGKKDIVSQRSVFRADVVSKNVVDCDSICGIIVNDQPNSFFFNANDCAIVLAAGNNPAAETVNDNSSLIPYCVTA